MALTLGVNSYVTLDEADLYFEDRLDVASWDAADDEMKEKALVTATRFIDSYSYAGYATGKTQNLAWPRKGSIWDPNRGRTLTFDDDYAFDSDTDYTNGNFASYISWFKDLPLEIQLLKKAVYEQAYHMINNDGLFDTQGANPNLIRVGSIELSGLGGASTPKRSSISFDLIRPLLINGSNAWFRAN